MLSTSIGTIAAVAGLGIAGYYLAAALTAPLASWILSGDRGDRETR